MTPFPAVYYSPKFPQGFTAAVVELGLRCVDMYMTTDGILLTAADANNRTYPLNHQPKLVTAVTDSRGQLQPVLPGQWLLVLESGLQAMSDEVFRANTVPAFDPVDFPELSFSSDTTVPADGC